MYWGREPIPKSTRRSPHWNVNLDREGVEGLFFGPERLFHLRSDAASLLWEQCGGDPKDMAATLTAWIEHGSATWEQGALVLTRSDLTRLSQKPQVRLPPVASKDGPTLPEPLLHMVACVHLGWPDTGPSTLARLTGLSEAVVARHCRALEQSGWVERRGSVYRVTQLPPDLHAGESEPAYAIHSAIADSLATVDPRKLDHLAAARRWEALADVALAQGQSAVTIGDLGQARTSIEHGLQAARWLDDPVLEKGLLEVLLQVTLAEDTRRSFELMHYALNRCQSHHPGLLALLRAAQALQEGAMREAKQQVLRLPDFDREELDRWRWALTFRLAVRGGLAADSVLRDAHAWARSRGTATALADVLNWEGIVAYRNGDVERAARLHGQAAEGKAHGTGRLSARANQAAALLEVPRLQDVLVAAKDLQAQAASLRHALYEAYAEWFLRVARYRLGEDLRPDWELVEATRQLEGGAIQGQLLFQEAVHAWRWQDLMSAEALATEAALAWSGDSRTALRTLPLALALASSTDATVEQAMELLAPAREEGAALPGIWLQIFGVLAWRLPALRNTGWQKWMTTLADCLPNELRIGRRELMTLEEVLTGFHTSGCLAMDR